MTGFEPWTSCVGSVLTLTALKLYCLFEKTENKLKRGRELLTS